MKKLFIEGSIILALVIGGIYASRYYTIYSTPAKIIYKTEIVEVEATSTTPVMERIAICESGNKHLGKSGQVLMVTNDNKSVDVGVMQINTIWFTKATELGYNLTIEKDNRAFANYLYSNFGTEPWVWSKGCWNK